VKDHEAQAIGAQKWHGAPLPMIFHGSRQRRDATLLQTFQPGHGGLERATVIVELNSVSGDVVAREIHVVNHAEGVANPPFAGRSGPQRR